MTQHHLPTDPVRVLLFGAATHNTHRIHYDPEFARSEGLPAPVVMVQMHGCLLFRAAAAVAGGDPSAVRSLSWRNVATAPVGTTLTATVERAGDISPAGDARLELTETGPDGTVFCQGSAVVNIPDGHP